MTVEEEVGPVRSYLTAAGLDLIETADGDVLTVRLTACPALRRPGWGHPRAASLSTCSYVMPRRTRRSSRVRLPQSFRLEVLSSGSTRRN